LFETGDFGGAGALAERSATPESTIPSVDWWITSRCNLACDFCYGPVPDRDPVSLREDILTAIKNCSASVVTFCGGEPLLVREIGRYAKELAEAGKRTVLNTNGSLLCRRVEQGLELAFSAVGLSIEGSSRAVHSAMRGAKADLDEVLRAAQLVASTAGVSLKLATVVSSVNRHDLLNLAELVGRLKPDVWRLYQYSARGTRNTGQQRHPVPAEEFHRLAEAATALAAPVPTAPSSEDMTAGCLIVDPMGNILQPGQTGYERRGNCLEDPLDSIWAKIPATTIVENKRWLSVLTK
jgi:MoaA/NifB/PqqE/SkfB family radical SAM enzyme